MTCRHCNKPVHRRFLDLGCAPPSNAYLVSEELCAPEMWYPLRVMVCDNCWLVQTEDFVQADELFTKEYSYFSSFSTGWLEHSRLYVESMVDRFSLSSEDYVVEIAANDGYLLQYFKAIDIPCLGVEPTAKVASAARAKGIDVVEAFFSVDVARSLARQGRHADLMIANNVLAHVPDINEFVSAFPILLKPNGVATFEFPYLPNLVSRKQFDTIYHEHFSYLSLTTVDRILSMNGLRGFDVESLPTHGGSLRVYAERKDSGDHPRNVSYDAMIAREVSEGLCTADYYGGFQAKVENIKHNFLRFLLECKSEQKVVVAYGAAAKGNTLLNFSGIRPDLISYVVDRNPAKQGKFMPGSRIPIVEEERLRQTRPDYVVIFPWNMKDEIASQLAYVREYGTRFVVTIPELSVW